MKNTLTLSAARQGIGIVVGVRRRLAARANRPAGRNLLEFGFWVAVFLPTLTVTLGWIMVFDSFNGLANQLWQVLFGVKGPFNIFSWWGIVWVHLVTGTIPLKVMLLTPAFRNMDATLEEASQASGASVLNTLKRVVLPIITPTILVVLLLGTIRSFEAFEVELVLGYEAQHRRLQHAHLSPGNLVAAAVRHGHRAGHRRSWRSCCRASSGSSGTAPATAWPPSPASSATSRCACGRWRWPLFGLIGGMVLDHDRCCRWFWCVMGTFMSHFGMFNVRDPWTLKSWQTVLVRHQFHQCADQFGRHRRGHRRPVDGRFRT